MAVAATLAAPATAARLFERTFSIGGYAGGAVPVEQEDVSTGYLAGGQLRGGLGPRFLLEAAVTVLALGDGSVEANGEPVTLPAPGMTTVAGNLLVRLNRSPGFLLYLSGGVGATWLDTQEDGGSGTTTRPTYIIGVGGEFGLGGSRLRGEVSPRLYIVDTDGASRKTLGVQVALNYRIG